MDSRHPLETLVFIDVVLSTDIPIVSTTLFSDVLNFFDLKFLYGK